MTTPFRIACDKLRKKIGLFFGMVGLFLMFLSLFMEFFLGVTNTLHNYLWVPVHSLLLITIGIIFESYNEI
jgi:hypothetical protein